MIDFDKYGHCCLCHKNMLIEQVIDGKVQKRFTPDYIENQYLLSDGSKMRVAMCVDCKVNLTDKQSNEIMQCVIKGWQVQVNELDWTDEKKKAHMDRYSQLEIVANAENVPQDILDVKIQEFQKAKLEQVKLKEDTLVDNIEAIHL